MISRFLLTLFVFEPRSTHSYTNYNTTKHVNCWNRFYPPPKVIVTVHDWFVHSNIELKTKQKSRSPSYPAIMRHRPPPFNTTHTGKSHPHLDLLLFLLFKPPRKEETNGNGSIFICTCCVCARARYHHKFPRKSARETLIIFGEYIFLSLKQERLARLWLTSTLENENTRERVNGGDGGGAL